MKIDPDETQHADIDGCADQPAWGFRRALPLESIHADDRAQPRAALSLDRIAEYVEDMIRGDQFPPLVVFEDHDKVRWLGDGFHRYHALVGVEAKTVDCVVHRGELRDAILFSVGANAAHGMRRTNDDKRQAVSKLLNDKEWSHWSDTEIARRCHVEHHMVARLRAELQPVTRESPSERTYRTKHGTTAKMKTGNVGRSRKRKDDGQDNDQPELPPQIVRDNENGWISTALWEIERQIDKLPPPREAAERFPTHHRHTFTAAKVHAMAEWLSDFAVAYGEETRAAAEPAADDGAIPDFLRRTDSVRS